MFRYFISCSILLLISSPILFGQNQEISLSFEESIQLLDKGNQSLQIADKEIEWARSEHQRLNAFWYPAINATGAYVHMANKIEVKESLNQFTDPAKDFIHSIIPDDQIISSILDKIGSYSLSFPLAPQDLTTIDANITWPIFTGGKRIYAGKIRKAMVSIAEVNKEQISANTRIALVESYFGVRLGQKVVEVREQTFQSLKKHYQNALKLEANGMINKAERLFVQVNMDEAKRELESAKKDLDVAQNALKTLIKMETDGNIRPISPLFINDSLPTILYFKSLIESNNYLINQMRLQENIANNELKIGRTGYIPNIALFGKQTLYAHGIEKNLLPRSMIGIGFSWNIFDGLDREKKIRQAKITKQTLALGKDKAIDDLNVVLEKFYSQIQNALNNVSALNTTIEMSKELVRIRKKSFTEGMATSTEVIDAEVMLSKVQIASLLAYYQYDVALINLLSACGIPDTFYQYSKKGKNEPFL